MIIKKSVMVFFLAFITFHSVEISAMNNFHKQNNDNEKQRLAQIKANKEEHKTQKEKQIREAKQERGRQKNIKRPIKISKSRKRQFER